MSRTEVDVVFNIVWTGDVYRYMHHFVDTLIEQSNARFRYITNACDAASIDAIFEAARSNPDRVIDVVDASPDDMVAHGIALDHVYDIDDESDLFCFIDTDIKARGPFVADFLSALETVDAVTSGREIWTDDNVVPDGHPGVGGRHFYRSDGYVYGSPHAAFYKRSVLDDTIGRWDVGFGSAGKPNVSAATWDRLGTSGHEYLLYDTGKIVNIMLQEDGHRLAHQEHDELVHIGGLAHYMSPPDALDPQSGEPTWVKWGNMTARGDVARFAADTLKALDAGRDAPELPDADPSTLDKLRIVRDELVDMATQPLDVRLQMFFDDYAANHDVHHVEHTLQVTSFGGAGTTALCRHLDTCGADIQPGPGHWPFKHRRTPPLRDEVPDGFRVIYLVGDPRDAVVSLFRRNYQVGHFRAMNLRDPSEAESARLESLDKLLDEGPDPFDLAGHVEGWLQPGKGYPVMVVRQHALSQAWPRIVEFAGLEPGLPPLPTNDRLSDWHDLPEATLAGINNVYGDLAERIAALPDVSIIEA